VVLRVTLTLFPATERFQQRYPHARPLTERPRLLANLLKKAPDNIRFSEELQGAGDEVLRVARQFGLEGLIAKRRDSRYESGRRSRSWVKVTTHQQEFVVGCRRIHVARWRPRKFRALLVGYNVPAGRLLYAGRVGSGFSEKALAELYGGLQTIRRATCPFVNLPEKSPGRWGLGLRLWAARCRSSAVAAFFAALGSVQTQS
jgi:bifunctional non-homologous end joining protein LigD